MKARRKWRILFEYALMCVLFSGAALALTGPEPAVPIAVANASESGPSEATASPNAPLGAVCGDPTAGDCCTATGSPGCGDEACCEAVCVCDAFCCDVEWDAGCAGPNPLIPGCSALDLCPACAPTGACCLGLECTITAEIACQGNYLGDGTDCDGNPCTPRGACCVWPDTCTVDTENGCTAGGGVYLGDDTDCIGAGTVVDTTALRRDIPDNDPTGGVSHTLNVAESFDLLDVDVGIHIIHTWTGDLVVEVEHLGTTATLINQPGDATDTPGPPYGCSADDYDIILDDEGSGGPIEMQCSANLSSPPNYTPNDPLSAFDGMDSAGGWTIKVTDTGEGETGMLKGWGVHMQGSAGAGPCDGVFSGACCDKATGACTDDVMEGDCTGDQLEWLKHALCAEIVCEKHTGACCDGTSGTCTDDVLPGDCTGDQNEWFKETPCSAIACVEHAGACCDGISGICTDEVLPGDCAGGKQEWFKDTACAHITCVQHAGACCDGITGTCTDNVTSSDCMGDQQTWFKAATCSQTICLQHTGACCDRTTGTCTDDVVPGDCVGDQQTWFKDTRCIDVSCLEHTGACCVRRVCTDDIPESMCTSDKWFKKAPCTDATVAEVCTSQIGVPALTQWGTVIMTLLLVVGARVYFGHRSPRTSRQ